MAPKTFRNEQLFLDALTELAPETIIKASITNVDFTYIFRLKSGRTFRAGDFNKWWTPEVFKIWEVKDMLNPEKIGKPFACTLRNLKKITSEPATEVKYNGPYLGGRVITEFNAPNACTKYSRMA